MAICHASYPGQVRPWPGLGATQVQNARSIIWRSLGPHRNVAMRDLSGLSLHSRSKGNKSYRREIGQSASAASKKTFGG